MYNIIRYKPFLYNIPITMIFQSLHTSALNALNIQVLFRTHFHTIVRLTPSRLEGTKHIQNTLYLKHVIYRFINYHIIILLILLFIL